MKKNVIFNCIWVVSSASAVLATILFVFYWNASLHTRTGHELSLFLDSFPQNLAIEALSSEDPVRTFARVTEGGLIVTQEIMNALWKQGKLAELNAYASDVVLRINRQLELCTNGSVIILYDAEQNSFVVREKSEEKRLVIHSSTQTEKTIIADVGQRSDGPDKKYILTEYPEYLRTQYARSIVLSIVEASPVRSLIRYHNMFHWNDVCMFFLEVAHNIPLCGNRFYVIELGLIAAYFHDAGYYRASIDTFTRQGHEKRSIKIVRENGKRIGLTPFETDAVCSMIAMTEFVSLDVFKKHVSNMNAVIADIRSHLVQGKKVHNEVWRTFIVNAPRGIELFPSVPDITKISDAELRIIADTLVAGKVLAIGDIYFYSSTCISLLPGLWSELQMEVNESLRFGQPTAFEQVGRIRGFMDEGAKQRMAIMLNDEPYNISPSAIPFQIQNGKDAVYRQAQKYETLAAEYKQAKASGDKGVLESIMKEIAQLVSTLDPIVLGGLPRDLMNDFIGEYSLSQPVAGETITVRKQTLSPRIFAKSAIDRTRFEKGLDMFERGDFKRMPQMPSLEHNVKQQIDCTDLSHGTSDAYIFEVVPGTMDMDVSITEGLNNLFYFDRLGNRAVFNPAMRTEQFEPIAHFGEHNSWFFTDSEGDHLGHFSVFSSEHPDKEIVAAVPNGNIFFNDYFVAYKQGKLYHAWKEPVENRIYTSLVRWNDGRFSVESLKYQRGANKQVRVYAHAKDYQHSYDITDKIQWASFGQQLAADGKVLPLSTYSDQIQDVNHLFMFPRITIEEKSIFRFGMKHLFDDRSLVNEVLQGGYAIIDYSDKTLKQYGYSLTQVTSDDIRNNLLQQGYKEGIDYYFVSDKDVAIRFRRQYEQHNALGIKEDGSLIVAVYNSPHHGLGESPESIADDLVKRGAQDVLLFANGGDQRLWFGGTMVSRSSVDRNHMSSCFVLSKKKNSDVPSAGLSERYRKRLNNMFHTYADWRKRYENLFPIPSGAIVMQNRMEGTITVGDAQDIVIPLHMMKLLPNETESACISRLLFMVRHASERQHYVGTEAIIQHDVKFLELLGEPLAQQVLADPAFRELRAWHSALQISLKNIMENKSSVPRQKYILLSETVAEDVEKMIRAGGDNLETKKGILALLKDSHCFVYAPRGVYVPLLSRAVSLTTIGDGLTYDEAVQSVQATMIEKGIDPEDVRLLSRTFEKTYNGGLYFSTTDALDKPIEHALPVMLIVAATLERSDIAQLRGDQHIFYGGSNPIIKMNTDNEMQLMYGITHHLAPMFIAFLSEKIRDVSIQKTVRTAA